ncbi:MAG: hypothetical protein SGBAC_003132 [Bacillariaceae sp.]
MNNNEEDTNLTGIMDPLVALADVKSGNDGPILMDELDVPREVVLQRILELVHHKVVRPLFVPGCNGSDSVGDDDDDDDDDDTGHHQDHAPPPAMIKIDKKSFFHLSHCRSVTSIILVASFCQNLLLANRTTTTREVYYFHVTHFFHQKECDKAIWDLARILKVSRSSLGLYASPKGWFCGCIDLYNHDGDLVLNGRELDNLHGMPITSTIHKQHTNMASHDAQFILVIEKEGVYTRLAEDKFFLLDACILVTGKGFPDMATRKWVRQMAITLQLPVYGLADCNPYGLAILHSYQYQQSYAQRQHQQQASNNPSNSNKINRKEDRPFVIQWLGLRPSQLLLDPQLNTSSLPPNVFQSLTERDTKLLKKFQALDLDENYHPFVRDGLDPEQRWHELELLARKVELEALNWKGMDFLSQWVHELIHLHRQAHANNVRHHPLRSSQAHDSAREVQMNWNQII